MRPSIRRRGINLLIIAGIAAGVGGDIAAQDAGAEAASDAAIRDYLSANGFLNRGLFELAATDYRKFLSQQSSHEKAPVARYGLAVCLFRMSKFDEAVPELEQLQKLADFTFAVEVSAVLGQCQMARQKYGAAAEAFGAVVRDHGDHALAVTATAGLAEALYLDGKYDAAIEQCRQLQSRWPESPLCERAEYFAAVGEMARQQHTAAGEQLSALLKKRPSGEFSEHAMLLLAQCQQQHNAPDKAAELYRRVLKKPDGKYQPDALYGLATILLQKGKPQEAAEFLDQLISKFADSPLAAAAKFQRARAWFDLNDLDQALQGFEGLAATKGDLEDDVAYWAAKCKLRKGDSADAARRLKLAIDKYGESPMLAEMNYDLAVALSRGGDSEAACKVLAEFRTRFGEHELAADALHLLAVSEHQRQAYDASQGHCREFLEKYAKHALAGTVAFVSAENDFLSGKFEPAIAGYGDFLARFGKDPQADKARFRLGMAYYRAEKPDEASKLLREAIEKAPAERAFDSAYLALADIEFGRGEWKQAEQLFEKYLTLGADVPAADDALLKLGLARQRQKRFAEALEAYDQLLRRFPKSVQRPQAMFERGQTLVALGKPAEAGEAFKAVLSDGGDSRFAPYVLNHLGALALASNDYAKAIECFDAIIEKHAGSEVEGDALLQRGQALLATQQFEPAEKSLTQFVAKFPKHPRSAWAQSQLAIALSRRDRHEDALKAIERAEGDASALDAATRGALQYEKAWCLRKLNKTEEAAAVYRKLVDQPVDGKPNVHAMLELAEIESAAKRTDAALALLRRIREMTTKNAADVPAPVAEQALYRLAVCQFSAEQYRETAELLEEFISKFPQSTLAASASYFCGESLFKTDRAEAAVKHLSRVVENFKSDLACGPSLLRLGECLSTLQHWPKAEQAFTDYLSQFADSEQWYQAQFGVGYARENQQRYEEAVAAYRRVVDRHKGPTAARAQFQIGECLFARNQYEDAARELLKVDILYGYPEWSAAALYEAGRCFDKLSKPVEARTQFAVVVEKHKQTRWASLASQRLSELSGGGLPGKTP